MIYLEPDALRIITETLHVKIDEIIDMELVKKGMTNRSVLFRCGNQRYIMRIPGEGTGVLINRIEEASVYKVISDKGISDDIVYIDPDSGYKITKFIEDARVCDAYCEEDIIACMRKLKEIHSMNLKVNHQFDIFGQIDFYESLWNGVSSAYEDYATTKSSVMGLKSYIERHRANMCLTHIDAVPDNFLFLTNGEVRLIDWEYAGMQDPHVDIAMFCIYALYSREQVDHLIDVYFGNHCEREIRIKIYCYIASCGLLWSNWCEYKRHQGVEFGEYALRQYEYAKEYCRIIAEECDA